MGKYSYGYDLQYIARGTQIGSFCSIAHGVSIGLMNHPTHFVSTHPFLYYRSRGFLNKNKNIEVKKTIIDDDVWIGINAVIMPGVHVGQGAIIGAGAVVTKDVQPYSIVGGVPAKPISKRFDKETIEKLINIRWGKWTDNKIKENIELFYNPKSFVEKVKEI